VLLPGTLVAQMQIAFTIHTPISKAPSRLGIAVAFAPAQSIRPFVPATVESGEWEITIGFDAARCEIYCEYRQKTHALTTTLPPPATEITIYTDSAAIPTTLTVDPAGLKMPVVRALVSVTQQELDRTKLHEAVGMEQRVERLTSPPARGLRSVRDPEIPLTFALSLRV
jgi:hypothetical protein